MNFFSPMEICIKSKFIFFSDKFEMYIPIKKEKKISGTGSVIYF